MTTKEILMSTKGLNKSFGATHAVVNLDINIEKGDIMGLIGENGAGKSTLIKIMGGEHFFDSGQIFYHNKKISWSNSAEALKKGIAIVHQHPLLVSSLNAAENIFLGKEFSQGFFVDNIKAIDETKKLIKKYPILKNLDIEKPVTEMSAGEKEVVEILKALSYDPEILILDEPTASLPKDETATLLSLLKELNKTNHITIIYISHKLEEAFEICNKITVMRNGKNIGTLTRDNFDKDKLVKMMINQDISEFYPEKSPKIGNKLLEVNNIISQKLRDVSIKVHEGEIVGLYGLIGAGMTELVESIYGLRPFRKGEIIFKDKKIPQSHVDTIIHNGIFLIPGDRHRYGLFPSFTVSENITIAHLFSLFPEFLLKQSKENHLAIREAKRVNLKYADINQLIQELSGGNQQKSIVARWLLKECEVLMLDDPTVGIDIGAKRDIYRILRELTSRNKGIIFISSEITEIIGISDRVYTMRRGKITANLSNKEINQENILKNIL
jgi:ABC-type sugar transport system ATPase subunit